MPETLPRQFGRYRILSQIGKGGMGVVYLAEDSRLGRRVALKIPHFAEQDRSLAVERFHREAKLAGLVDHPNLCRIHDVDCQDGIHYLAMAYIEGTPLSRMVGPDHLWLPGEAISLVLQLASALQALHEQGIIHRDLKPANVMIRGDGSPVLMDFGVARLCCEDDHLTSPGQIVGSPAYMAPEQAQADGSLPSPATDVYSLGIILYQLLTGRLPYQGSTLMEWLAQILYATPLPPSALRPELGTAYDGLFQRVLAKDPRARPATMTELATLLQWAPQPVSRAEMPTMTWPVQVSEMATLPPTSLLTPAPPLPPSAWSPSTTTAPLTQPPQTRPRTPPLMVFLAVLSAGLCLLLVLLAGLWLASGTTTRDTETGAELPHRDAEPWDPTGKLRQDFSLAVTLEGKGEEKDGHLVLTVGDELAFNIQVGEDAHLGIWAIFSDGKVLQICPREREPDAILRAGQLRRIPNPQSGRLRFTLTEATEWIYVAALTRPMRLPEETTKSFETKRAQDAALLAIRRGLPVAKGDRISEKVLHYTVKPKPTPEP